MTPAIGFLSTFCPIAIVYLTLLCDVSGTSERLNDKKNRMASSTSRPAHQRYNDPRYSVVLPVYPGMQPSTVNPTPHPNLSRAYYQHDDNSIRKNYGSIIGGVINNPRIPKENWLNAIKRYIETFAGSEHVVNDQFVAQLQRHIDSNLTDYQQLPPDKNYDIKSYIKLIIASMSKIYSLIVAARRPNKSVCETQKEKYSELFEDPLTLERLCEQLEHRTHTAEKNLFVNLNSQKVDDVEWATEPEKILRQRNGAPVAVTQRFIYENAVVFLSYQMWAVELNNEMTPENEMRFETNKTVIQKTYIPFMFLPAFLQLLRYHHKFKVAVVAEWKHIIQAEKNSPYKTYVDTHSPSVPRPEFWHFIAEFALLLSEGCPNEPLTCAINSAVHSIEILENGLSVHFATIPDNVSTPLIELKTELKSRGITQLNGDITPHKRPLPSLSKEAAKADTKEHAHHLFACALQIIAEARLFSKCLAGRCHGQHIAITLPKKDTNSAQKTTTANSSKLTPLNTDKHKRSKSKANTTNSSDKNPQTDLNIKMANSETVQPIVTPASVLAILAEKRQKSTAVRKKSKPRDQGTNPATSSQNQANARMFGGLDGKSIVENKQLMNLLSKKDSKTSTTITNANDLLQGRMKNDFESTAIQDEDELFIRLVRRMMFHVYSFIVSERLPHQVVCSTKKVNENVLERDRFFRHITEDPRMIERLCARLIKHTEEADFQLMWEISYGPFVTDESADMSTTSKNIVHGDDIVVLTPFRIMSNARVILEFEVNAVSLYAKLSKTPKNSGNTINHSIVTKTVVIFPYLPAYIQLIRYISRNLLSTFTVKQLWYIFGYELKTIEEAHPATVYKAVLHTITHSPVMPADQWNVFWHYVAKVMRIQYHAFEETTFDLPLETTIFSVSILQGALKDHFNEIPQRITMLLEQFKKDFSPNEPKLSHSESFTKLYPNNTKAHLKVPTLNDKAVAAGAQPHAEELYQYALRILEDAYKTRSCMAQVCDGEHNLVKLERSCSS